MTPKRTINAVIIDKRSAIVGAEHRYYGTYDSLEEFRQALIDDPEITGFSDGQSFTPEYSVINVTLRSGENQQLAWRWNDHEGGRK